MGPAFKLRHALERVKSSEVACTLDSLRKLVN